jgi:hypothetical protein
VGLGDDRKRPVRLLNKRSMTEIAPAQSPPTRKPRSAAMRMARSRERRRKGLFCLTLELRQTEVQMFIKCGLVKPEEARSPVAIKRAVYSVLDDFTCSRRPIPSR